MATMTLPLMVRVDAELLAKIGEQEVQRLVMLAVHDCLGEVARGLSDVPQGGDGS